jgi:hypothetical protein
MILSLLKGVEMNSFLHHIYAKVKVLKSNIDVEVKRVKLNFSNMQFLRKLIVIIVGTAICAATSAWLASESSLGKMFYTYHGYILSIALSIFLAPFFLNYAIEIAKTRYPGWSYFLGAKAGSCLGLIIALLVGFCSINLKAKWVLDELSMALKALVLTLVSGLIVGAIIGMLLLPILRLAVYGSQIIKDGR